MKIQTPLPGLSRVFPTVLSGLLLPAAMAAGPDPSAYNRNWPQWRGPAANGLVLQGDPPLEWSEEKNVRWKVPIPGSGHATPIIWENQIFIMTAVPSGPAPQAGAAQSPKILAGQQAPPPGPPGQGRRPGGRGPGGERPSVSYAYTVLCLDRSSGKIVWEQVARKAVPHQGVQSSNSYSSGSPLTDGERLYVSFGSEGLYCYDLAGKLLWQKDLGKVEVTFGEGSSPALAGDVLVVLQDNNNASFVYGLDKLTGQERWKKSREEGSGWTTPYVVQHGGRTQVIISGEKAIRGYDPANGEVIWQCSGLGSNPIPMAVADQNAVYVMSGHSRGVGPIGLAIKLGRTGDLTGTDAVLWKITGYTPYVPSPLLYDGLLYFPKRFSEMVSCVDAATGEPHYKEERLEALSGLYSSPIGVRNRVYYAGQNGATVILERSKELKILATNKLEDGFDASPAVVGNELFLRGRKNLYCLAAN